MGCQKLGEIGGAEPPTGGRGGKSHLIPAEVLGAVLRSARAEQGEL